MEKEPLWRTILNYGAVAYFLGIPALVITVGLFDIELFPAGSGAPQFLRDFHLTVSAIVAAMAGLNSFDRYKSNGKQQESEKT